MIYDYRLDAAAITDDDERKSKFKAAKSKINNR